MWHCVTTIQLCTVRIPNWWDTRRIKTTTGVTTIPTIVASILHKFTNYSWRIHYRRNCGKERHAYLFRSSFGIFAILSTTKTTWFFFYVDEKIRKNVLTQIIYYSYEYRYGCTFDATPEIAELWSRRRNDTTTTVVVVVFGNSYSDGATNRDNIEMIGFFFIIFLYNSNIIYNCQTISEFNFHRRSFGSPVENRPGFGSSVFRRITPTRRSMKKPKIIALSDAHRTVKFHSAPSSSG